METLPNIVLLKILGFLPAKEAHRLTSVSKQFGDLINENPSYMKKMKATITISDGFGKGFTVEKMPFEMLLETERKTIKIYASSSVEFSGNVSFCKKFAHSLKVITKTWYYEDKFAANADHRLRYFRNGLVAFRDFAYQVNPRFVHAKDFPIVVLFERISAVMDITELTVEQHMYPLMQHVLGQLAKTCHLRLDTLILPMNPKSKEDECEEHEMCKILDSHKNKNSKIMLFDPMFGRDMYGIVPLQLEDMNAMNALAEKYKNSFWVTSLTAVYGALKAILSEWAVDTLKELRFSFLILQGRKLEIWRARHRFDLRMREYVHSEFVEHAKKLGICSNFFNSDYAEWVNIESLPDTPLEFYFGPSRTVRVVFEKRDEETAIARLSMFLK